MPTTLSRHHCAGPRSRDNAAVALGSDVLVLSLMIHAPRHVEWPSDSAWTGCGGNPTGTARCEGLGNCGDKCEDCGASTHWRCCGSSDRASEFCAPGTRPEQARRNNEIAMKPYDPDDEKPTYAEQA
ncbi:unnamed protein product [Cladocopium goreaui]|uniref:Pentatricopeptide repeat-containing protein, chloroplastic n=1 Tax=Cladocopium goreaui TaxID=2562237 RepID=A0A9P1GRN5_9DINO|nr:unnamed protein product [Cladocopium goreaui]